MSSITFTAANITVKVVKGKMPLRSENTALSKFKGMLQLIVFFAEYMKVKTKGQTGLNVEIFVIFL